jgi:hypothetical protein
MKPNTLPQEGIYPGKHGKEILNAILAEFGPLNIHITILRLLNKRVTTRLTISIIVHCYLLYK